MSTETELRKALEYLVRIYDYPHPMSLGQANGWTAARVALTLPATPESTPVEPLYFTVLPTEDDVTLACPDPECKGHVVEVDEAIRWNPLFHRIDKSDGEHYLWTHTSGDSSWERREPYGFICDSCVRPVFFDGDAAGLIESINYD